MDGLAAIEAKRRALKRIVALLLSLAVLACRASERSAPVRFFVHLVVSRAETAVLTFLGVPAEEAHTRAPVLPGRSDLLILSARLGALALLLVPGCGTGPCPGKAQPVPGAVPALRAIKPQPLLLPPYHDTS